MFQKPHLNPRGVGRIQDSYANPRRSRGFASLQCRRLAGPVEFPCWGDRVRVTILRQPFYRPRHVRRLGMGEGKNEKTK